MKATVLLIVHGLVAVALLGAITHQTLSAWAPANARPGSFFGRFRTVPPAAFANAVVLLYSARRDSGRDRLPRLPGRRTADAGAGRPLAGPRILRSQGAFRRHRRGAAAGLLGVLAAPARGRAPPSARDPDLDHRLHRLVGLPRRACHEQHHGIRGMTGSRAFRRFAFAFGAAFAGSLRGRAQAGSRAVHRLSVARDRGPRARTIREMPSIPRSGSSLRRCTGTAGPPRPCSERSWSASLQRCCPGEWTQQRLWVGWICGISAFAMLACVYLTLPWFRL